MYWMIFALIIAILLFYIFLKRRGNFDFWKLIAKFPDEAYDFFINEGSWIVFVEKPGTNFQDALPEGEWDGPFRLVVPSINRIVYIFGRVPDYHESQKEFKKRFAGNQ
jgi:hypothetical protein